MSIGLVVGFFALGFSYAPEANAGQPTPFLGLFERIGFSAYFLWLAVLAVASGLGRRSKTAPQT